MRQSSPSTLPPHSSTVASLPGSTPLEWLVQRDLQPPQRSTHRYPQASSKCVYLSRVSFVFDLSLPAIGRVPMLKSHRPLIYSLQRVASLELFLSSCAPHIPQHTTPIHTRSTPGAKSRPARPRIVLHDEKWADKQCNRSARLIHLLGRIMFKITFCNNVEHIHKMQTGAWRIW